MYVPAVVVEACTRYVLFVEEVDPELRVRTQQTPNPGKSFRFELKDLFMLSCYLRRRIHLQYLRCSTYNQISFKSEIHIFNI